MINVWIALPVAVVDEIADERKGVVKHGQKKLEAFAAQEVKTLKDAIDFPEFARKRPVIAGKRTALQSVYVNEESEIDELEKGGATILGAWNWDGSQVRKPVPDLKRYMPPKLEQRGEETVEVDDEEVRDLNLKYGQTERNFG